MANGLYGAWRPKEWSTADSIPGLFNIFINIYENGGDNKVHFD